MDQKLQFTTLFILGAGHSGSTLVGRMLSMHPGALFVGELLRLDVALANDDERCTCKQRLVECPFWSRWIEKLPAAIKKDYRNWTYEWLERMRVGEGKDLFIDSSKSRAHRLTEHWSEPRIAYVLMVRDPRGAMRAALKRGGELGAMLQSHCKWMKRYEAFVRKKTSLVVHYEDLVASPETALKRICDFLGLDYLPAMLSPNSEGHLVRASWSNYLRGEKNVQLDERWRTELTPEQISEIDTACGSIGIYRDRYEFSEARPRRRWTFSRK